MITENTNAFIIYTVYRCPLNILFRMLIYFNCMHSVVPVHRIGAIATEGFLEHVFLFLLSHVSHAKEIFMIVLSSLSGGNIK